MQPLDCLLLQSSQLPMRCVACIVICCVLADEAGNNLQVVMMHRTQRAVFEIDTPIEDVLSVIPGLLLHVHDTLYTGLVRRAQDAVVEALPVCPWPRRPAADDAAGPGVRRAGDSLEGKWVVEWRNGTTLLHGASLLVTNGTFRVMDTDYTLEWGEQAGQASSSRTVSFRWPDGTLQTMVADEGSFVRWCTTSEPPMQGIVWRRGWGGFSESGDGAQVVEGGDAVVECAICCEALSGKCAWLACNHAFHETCIKKYSLVCVRIRVSGGRVRACAFSLA